LAVGAAIQAVGRTERVDRAGHEVPTHPQGTVRVLPGTRIPADWAVTALVGVLALVNLPTLWQAELVDPVLSRDEQPPAAWRAAADDLDDPTGRVLQLPGLEFGAFRWGYTVDQPLAGMTD